MKNKGNTAEAEKYNPPTEHQCEMDGKPAGTCFVYDPAAYGRKARLKFSGSKPKKQAKPEAKKPVRGDGGLKTAWT
jgi:hypothetical protein